MLKKNQERPINIANILEEAKFGGPQARIVTVASVLVNTNVNTTVIFPEENSQVLKNKCKKLNIPYKIIWMSRITKELRIALRYVLFFPYEVIRLSLLLKQGDYDIVHISGGSWQYKGAIAAKLAGKKIIWHLNDAYMPYLFRRIFKSLSFLADAYIYSAKRSEEYYQPFIKGNRPSFIIHPPVDTAIFSPDNKSNNDEVLELINKYKGKTVIGTVANINPVKGIETFIKAAEKLNKIYKGLVFIVIGRVQNSQKKYYESLQKLAVNLSVKNLCFLGECANVSGLLKRIDIYACTSNSESGPMTLFEAMSMEKAIVSTNVGDVSHFIKNGSNGFIVDVGDYLNLSQKLSILVSDSGMRRKFGISAREIAIKELDISICALKHYKAYNTIIKL